MTRASPTKIRRQEDREAWRPPVAVTSPNLRIEVDKETCTGCRLCVLACPTNCLEFEHTVSLAYVVRLDTCIVCRACEVVCRPDSIRVLLEGVAQ